MNNILFLRSNPVNPDSRVEKEVESLIKNGYSVSILAWDRSTNQDAFEEKKFNNTYVNIYRIGIKSSFGSGFRSNIIPMIKFQQKMKKWLKLNIDKFDLIHACDFDTAYTSIKVAKKHKKHFIYDIFDFYVESFSVPRMFQFMIKKMDFKVINKSDAIILCTEQRVNQIKGSKPKKIAIIHNTPNTNYSRKNNTFYNSKINLVYIGILSNHRFLIEMTEIVKNYNQINLHIGGFGIHEEYFKKMSNEYSNVIFYGKLQYSQVLELEEKGDFIIAVYSPQIKNHRYSAPNKLYEAMYLGKRIIVANGTGIDEIVRENNLGYAIEYDKEAFKRFIEKLILEYKPLDDAEKNKIMSLYYSGYNWAIMEERLVKLYEDLISYEDK